MLNADRQRFTAAWRYCKIKVPVETFVEVYNHYPEIYKHDRMQALTPEEMDMISSIFHFTAETFLGWKNQFIKFVSQHKEFYHDDVAVMIEKMKGKVAEFRHKFPNQTGVESIKYINWLPPYGGVILDRKVALSERREVFASTGPLSIGNFFIGDGSN